jgi:superfamily I DNA/RNA helicase
MVPQPVSPWQMRGSNAQPVVPADTACCVILFCSIVLSSRATGRRPHAATEEQVRSTLAKAAKERGVTEFTARFLFAEWTYIVDAWQLDSAKAYTDVPRLGRKNRLGAKQRARLWPIFEAARDAINRMGLHTWAQICAEVTAYYSKSQYKPFSHIVVDEAQDLGVPELRLLAAIAPAGTNALFFSGDLGQRIFQQPFSWTTLGVDVRGQSQTLKVNYRTSHQIRQAADRLLPSLPSAPTPKLKQPLQESGFPRRLQTASSRLRLAFSCAPTMSSIVYAQP